MKRNLFLLFFTIVLSTASLTAQRPGAQPGPRGAGPAGEDVISLRDRCCQVIPSRRILVRVLEMDEGQLEQVAALHQAIAETVGPLREELKALAAALREELASDSPDPCEVGRLLLAIRALQVEICATLRAFDPEFEAILGPEQLEKWLTIKPRFCHRNDRPRPGRGDRPGRDGEN